MSDISGRFEFDIHISNGVYRTRMFEGNHIVCECKICVNDNHDTWSISAWYTDPVYQHQGHGIETLQFLVKKMLDKLGEPEKIEYIWNGANQYVMDWLEVHFSPVCKLPLAVRKYQDADDWDAHIYILNKKAFLKYVCS